MSIVRRSLHFGVTVIGLAALLFSSPVAAQEEDFESPTCHRLTDRDAWLIVTLTPLVLRDAEGEMRMIGAKQDMVAQATAEQGLIRNGNLDPEARLRKIVGAIPLPHGLVFDRGCTADHFPYGIAVYVPKVPAPATKGGAGLEEIVRRTNPHFDKTTVQMIRDGGEYMGAWDKFLSTKYPVVEKTLTGGIYFRRKGDLLEVESTLATHCSSPERTTAALLVRIPYANWVSGRLETEHLSVDSETVFPSALRKAGVTEEYYSSVMVVALDVRKMGADGGKTGLEGMPPEIMSPDLLEVHQTRLANLQWWARHQSAIESVLTEYERMMHRP